MKIRPATQLDASAILALLLVMHAEAPAGVLSPVQPDKALTRIVSAIGRGVALVAIGDDGRILGSIGGEAASDWYGEQTFLGDLWFFVHPEYRASRAAILLLRAFKSAGEAAGLRVRVGDFNGHDVERKACFYERAGFTRVGSFFVNGV